MTEATLRWATSQSVGGVSEIAVMAPIKKGTRPGERQTYEERVRGIVANIAKRHLQGIPTELDAVPTIHFGRIMVIRPEQYLLYSNVDNVPYEDPRALRRVPKPIDDYEELPTVKPSIPELRSFLLILVEFDGDIKVYMRDIALFLAERFDNIFDNCEDYPGFKDFELFWLWIRRYQINTDLFYSTYPNLSVARIKQLEAFKRRFDDFVGKVRSPKGATVRCLDELFDEFLRENLQYGVGFPSQGGVYPTEGEDAR